jgi:hypothetical protein
VLPLHLAQLRNGQIDAMVRLLHQEVGVTAHLALASQQGEQQARTALGATADLGGQADALQTAVGDLLHHRMMAGKSQRSKSSDQQQKAQLQRKHPTHAPRCRLAAQPQTKAAGQPSHQELLA